MEVTSGHPRPSSMEALVYRGFLCGDPPVCHRVQDASVAKREPFFVLLGVVTSCVLCARVRGRVSRSCATENTYKMGSSGDSSLREKSQNLEKKTKKFDTRVHKTFTKHHVEELPRIRKIKRITTPGHTFVVPNVTTLHWAYGSPYSFQLWETGP